LPAVAGPVESRIMTAAARDNNPNVWQLQGNIPAVRVKLNLRVSQGQTASFYIRQLYGVDGSEAVVPGFTGSQKIFGLRFVANALEKPVTGFL